MISAVMALSVVRNIEDPASVKEKLARVYLRMVTTAVVLAWDWDFAMDVADMSVVSGQRDYVLKGNNQNCLNLFNIRYGTGDDDDGYDPLKKKLPADIDEWLLDRNISGIGIWVPHGRMPPRRGFPRVRILDTPDDSTKILRYRFWIKGLRFEDLPVDVFDSVVMEGIKEKFIGKPVKSPRVQTPYERELDNVIGRYQPPTPDEDPMKQDPLTVRLNNHKSTLYGYGG